MFYYMYSRVAILCYSGAAFGQRTPPLLVEKLESLLQLISNEVFDVYQISYGYISQF